MRLLNQTGLQALERSFISKYLKAQGQAVCRGYDSGHFR